MSTFPHLQNFLHLVVKQVKYYLESELTCCKIFFFNCEQSLFLASNIMHCTSKDFGSGFR